MILSIAPVLITRDGVEVCSGQTWRTYSQAYPGLCLVQSLRGGNAILHGNSEVVVPVSRMHKGRRGWALVQAPSAEYRRLQALVGQPVHLVRGARGRTEGPGHERRVMARLDSVSLNLVMATLLQDDPVASTPPHNAGEQGTWHGYSVVEPMERLQGGH